MEHDKPDFVPSVFTSTKQKQSPKKKVKWFYGRRKRHRRKARTGMKGKKTSLPDDSSADLQPSVFMETEKELSKEMQTPATPSVPKEGETETKIIQSQPPFKALPDSLKLDKKSPIVLLKPIVAPAGGYQCELCNQTFTNLPQLVKHRQLHEEQRSCVCKICGKSFKSQAGFAEHHAVHRDEPSFQCNMCDRSFTTSHHLKRHKLLHVKDGRKCLRCGTLFCRRHNHILFLPQTESKTESEPEDDSSMSEPENGLLNELEPSQMTEITGNTQSSRTVTPLLSSSALTAVPTPPIPGFLSKSPPSASLIRLPETPSPALLKPCPMPRPFFPKLRHSRNLDCLPQNPELPPSLKLFSPQYLTSALLEVKRNYEYILAKPKNVKAKNTVKKEQGEPRIMSPGEQCTSQEKKERIAYDMEIVL